MSRYRHLRPATIALLAVGLLLHTVARADTPLPLTGALANEQGVRVLRLHGDAFSRGYTHGALLGPEICRLATGVLLSPFVWPDMRYYEETVRQQVVPLFTFTAEQERELEGMMAGLRAREGAGGLRIASLNRDLDVVDLKAINVFADIQNGGCTSFAAWGPATRDGGTVVGRNLDFNRLPGIAESQLLIVRTDAAEGRKRWVTVGWPGMIGAYTAMNEDGVFIAMHDVRAPTDPAAGPFVPRSLAIREIAETAGAKNAVDQAAAVLRASRAFCGNNFLVAAPFTGQDNPAAVLEYDGRSERDGGVSLRTVAWKDHRLPANTIACTNHYRMRGDASPCDRYAKVRRMLVDHPTGEIDAALALQVQTSVAVDMTLHTVVALLNPRELTVSFCTADRNATQNAGVRFTLDELLGAGE